MNGIHIKTANGWAKMGGTGVSEMVTVDTLPEQYRCPPTTLTGTYQDPETNTKFGFMYDWFTGVGRRNADFNLRQVDLLNA